VTGPSAPIVVAFPTVMDGLVLRWYRTEDAWKRSTEVISASRNGVSIHCEYLHQVPAGWLEDAQQAHRWLESGRVEQARQGIATHRPTRLIGGELEPIGGAR
jgi:hypothetical protein